MKKTLDKSLLMTALICGNALWGGYSSIRRREFARI